MKPLTDDQIERAIAQFSFHGDIKKRTRCSIGHINDTFFIDVKNGEEKRYVLQRIDSDVFPKPRLVMDNIIAVTSFLRKKVIARGGDPRREVLSIILTKDGHHSYTDPDGNFFRLYLSIPGSTSYNETTDPKILYEGAYSFGLFQRDLSDFPVKKLHTTIADFHNTPKRLRAFLDAVNLNKAKRLDTCQDAVNKAIELQDVGLRLSTLAPKLPLRVSHNDTKLNNVMFDAVTHKGLCPIDLDTIMPGLSATDFGDAVRFGCDSAPEDEKDLSKIHLDMKLFGAYLEGYLAGCGNGLSDDELLSFPAGAEAMAYEVGIRFLTDYLNGDTYFHIDHPTHNLERALSQFALLESMDRHHEEMLSLIKKHL